MFTLLAGQFLPFSHLLFRYNASANRPALAAGGLSINCAPSPGSEASSSATVFVAANARRSLPCSGRRRLRRRHSRWTNFCDEEETHRGGLGTSPDPQPQRRRPAVGRVGGRRKGSTAARATKEVLGGGVLDPARKVGGHDEYDVKTDESRSVRGSCHHFPTA